MTKNITTKITGVLKNGTMAGILTALFILLLFILAATFLKSLIFGLILACFFLPLEKFFEHHFFQWPIIRWLWPLSSRINDKFITIKNRYIKSKERTPEEIAEKKRQYLVMRSTAAAVLSVVIVLLLILTIVGFLLIPGSAKIGKTLDQWVQSTQVLRHAEESVSYWTGNDLTSKENKVKVEQASQSIREFIQWLRPTVREYLQTHQKELTKLAFSKGKDILSTLLAIAAKLGGLAFDLLMTLVFFFFFLYQLALFMRGDAKKEESLGKWCVRGIFASGWMPHVSGETRQEAAELIDRIAFMLTCWIRGYLWIIIIEMILYEIAFAMFSVPYGALLAIPSSMTVLLPVLGIIGNILLTLVVCILFCEGNLIGTLIGVALTYLIINGILEQLIMYPSFVGGAIGLTILETIIVVLLGGYLAGISGMIFAVPAAAILKYLIPKIYSSLQTES